MPNVMGREFPYTPQGMAEAEQYRQAVGMRGGGMMGFRPVGYADGNLVTAMAQRPRREDLEDEGLDVYLGLQSLLEEGDRQKILDYLYQNDGIIQRDRENNPSRSEFFDGVKQFYNYEQYFRDLMQQPDSNFVRTGMVGEDPELRAMVDEAREDARLYVDPAFQMAEDERAAGMSPERIRREQQQLEQIREQFPGPLAGDEPLGPMPEFRPPFMDDPRYKGYFNPNQSNPFFNPDEIEVADGGYISRKMKRGGIMSLRGY